MRSKNMDKEKRLSAGIIKKTWTCALLVLAVWTPLEASEAISLHGQPQPRLAGEIFQMREETVGSPFYIDHWLPGEVVLSSGATVGDVLLMYNGFSDQLIYQHPSTYETIIVDKNTVSEFRLFPNGVYEEPLVFRHIEFRHWTSRLPVRIYARMLYSGLFSLFVYQKVEKTGDVAEYSPEGPQIRAKLEPQPAYFILPPGGQAIPLKRFNRRTFYQLFPDHADQIREAFRRNHLRIRNESELVEAVKIIDQVVR